MSGWPAAIDAACARMNPALLLVALILTLLDVSTAARRWDALHPALRVQDSGTGARCGPATASGLNDMIGRD